MKAVSRGIILLFIGSVSQAVVAQPLPYEDEPFERFVERWNTWVDTIPEKQRAVDALDEAVDQIQSEAFSFGELWNKRGYNEGDVLSEAFPWNEYWIEAPAIFESYESQLNQLNEIASRSHLAAKIVDNSAEDSEELLPDALIQHHTTSSFTSARTAASYLTGHASYLAFNGQTERACERLHAVNDLARHTTELPTAISWLVEAAIEQRFQGTIIEILKHDPDLFNDQQLTGFQAAIVEQISTGFVDTLQFEQWITEETWRVLYDSLDPHLTDQEINKFFYEVLGSPDCLMEDSGLIFWEAAKPQSEVVVGSLESQLKLYRKFNQAIQHDLAQDPSMLQTLQFLQLAQDHLSGDGEQRYMPILMKVFLWRDQLGLQLMLDYEARNTLVVIGIYRHRLSTGSWPTTLSEINTDFLPYGITDLYSGNPLNYQRGRKSMILWAHGADRGYEGGSLFNKDADLRMVKQWFSRKEWGNLSDESREIHAGDWKFWQYTVE